MTQNSGTLVIAPIRPNDSADTYPSAHAIDILGGWKSAADAAARAAIPTARLESGCVCWQVDTGVLYRWDGAAWQVVTFGGGAATSINLGTATITGTLPSANSGALTGDVTKPAGSSTTTVAAINLGTVTLTGTFPSSATPALTGEVTKPAGSSTTTVDTTFVTNKTALPAASLASDDQFPVYDTSAAGYKKVSKLDLFMAITLADVPSHGYYYQGTASGVSGNPQGDHFATDPTRGRICALCTGSGATLGKVQLFNPKTFLKEVDPATFAQLSTTICQVFYNAQRDSFVVLNGMTAGNQRIYEINPTTLAITQTITDAEYGTRVGCTYGQYVYGMDSTTFKLARVDLNGGATVLSPSMAGGGLYRTVIDGVNGILYTIHGDTKVRATLLSGFTTTFGGTVSAAIANTDSSSRLMLCPYDGTLWVTRNNGTIVVLDPTTLAVLTTITITGLTLGLYGMAYHATRNLVYVKYANNNAIYVIDAVSRTPINALGTGSSGTLSGESIGFDPATARVCSFNAANAISFWQG